MYSDYFCFNYPKNDNGDYYNSSGKAAVYKEAMDALGYRTDIHINETPISMNTLLSMGISDALVYRGHGAGGYLEFHSADGTICGGYGVVDRTTGGTTNYSAYVEDLSYNALSNVRFILLLGCSTGTTNKYGDCFLNAFYDKGAHFVLGTYDTVYAHNSDQFVSAFVSYLDDTTSIKATIDRALESMNDVYLPTYGEYGDYPVIYKGDSGRFIRY